MDGEQLQPLTGAGVGSIALALALATGWIKQLQARADGLWGLVEWTERRRGFLAAKEYRYMSPAFNHAPSGEVTHALCGPPSPTIRC